MIDVLRSELKYMRPLPLQLERLSSWERRARTRIPVLRGQPYDKLLLRISKQYARTRALAIRLGASFAPVALTKNSSILNYSIESARIPYTPLAGELEWLLTSPVPGDTRFERLAYLAQFTSVVYHDSNHFILGAHFAPETETKESLLKYFALMEAMVIYRDFELAWELGPLARPLKSVGLLYEAEPPVRSRRNLELILKSLWLHLLGFNRKRLDATLRRQGLPSGALRPSIESRAFASRTIPEWFGLYLRRNGEKFVNGAPGLRDSAYRIKTLDAGRLAADHAIWKELGTRYRELFKSCDCELPRQLVE